MIYGMYLSATGLITSSHQQDVIANNIANAETSGFKRAMATLEARQVESQVLKTTDSAHKLLDHIGGGQLLRPTFVDFTQGAMEQSSNPLDTAISGNGFIAVRDGSGETRLTRAGSLMVDRQGNLITAQGHTVLNDQRQPIKLPENVPQQELTIGTHGELRHGPEQLATIGLFEPTEQQALKPVGENLFALTGDARLVPATGQILGGMVERSNVDPAKELTQLMEAQRLLETNANMIRYQDATLAKCVNEVGKIG